MPVINSFNRSCLTLSFGQLVSQPVLGATIVGLVIRLSTLLILVLCSSQVRAEFEKGAQAMQRGNYVGASIEMTNAAEKGDASAQYVLARFYEGLSGGVVPDDELAVKWYTKAAEGGNPEAQYTLATMYENGDLVRKNQKEYIKWLRKSAENRHPRAQSDMGSNYFNGEGVKRNKAEAVEWYKKSALSGDSLGQYNLAIMYETGNGVPENLVESYALYSLSAEKEHEHKNPGPRQSMAKLKNKIGYDGMIAAEERADSIKKGVQENQDLQERIRFNKLVHTQLVKIDEFDQENRSIRFNGFSVVPLQRSSLWGSPLDYESYKETNISSQTTILFHSNLGDKDVVMMVSLMNLNENKIVNARELYDYAKATGVAARISGYRAGKASKYKLKKESIRSEICIDYDYSLKNRLKNLFQFQIVMGRYRYGKGILCIHPMNSSVLVNAQYREVMNSKKNSKEIKKSVQENGAEVLRNIAFEPLIHK